MIFALLDFVCALIALTSGVPAADAPITPRIAGQWWIFLFRTQHYGENAKTSVYHSRDPLDFGIDNDAGYFVTTLPVAAPEILQEDGKWYIAALLPNLKGIQIASLEWVPSAR